MRQRTLEADVVINPDVSHIHVFEFYNGKEAILSGYKATRKALPKMQRVIERQ